VTGLATPSNDFTVPSSVFSVDDRNQIAKLVTDLVGPSEGSDFVLADHDRRLVVIGSPNVKPTRLVVLSMDAPSKPQSIPTSYDGSLIQAFLYENRDGRPVEAFHVGPFEKGRLIGFDLLAAGTNTAPLDLPWDDYRYVRREGVWPPGDDTRLDVFPKDGKLVLDPNKVKADLGVSIPGNIKRGSDEAFLLDVNNDDMLVINRTKLPGKAVMGGGGATELLVYDKKSQLWDTVRFQGAGSSVRGFGHWLALAEGDIKRAWAPVARVDNLREKESPGSAFRQMQVLKDSRFTVDGLFRETPYYYPGRLYLYDVRSRKQYQIKTDQGDSEVLLVDGDTVYYRVNQILYRASIGETELESPVQILTGDTVQLAHWAFIGPPDLQ
jgi:hypothetical protein